MAGFAVSINGWIWVFTEANQDREVLWYIPNEIGGITMMKPEDY